MIPKKIDIKSLYKGRIFELFNGLYEHNGRTFTREFIKPFSEAVVILPILPDGRIALVRQFRSAAGIDVLESVAGMIDEGETPEVAAFRELEEETGFSASKITKLGRSYASPGISSEIYHFYLAQDLTKGAPHPDEDEDLDLVLVAPEELDYMIASGKIFDTKTIAIWGLWRSSK
jgi:ADP-ribose pyrophosphatase